MADKTIPGLTTASLQTGYFLPFAINTSTEANKTTVDGIARFIYENYIAAQPAPYYTDSISVNYGGYGVFGNLYASGKFHSRGTGYFDSISAGSINGNTIGNPNAHIIAGPSSIIQNSPYSVILGGQGGLIKHNPPNGGSVIIGGVSNTIESSSYNVILGGTSNTLSGLNSVILGGESNITYNTHCGIVGGLLNSLSGMYGTIVGGNSNTNFSNNSSIVGSNLSTIATGPVSSAIVAGGEHSITTTANYCFIGGGYRNTLLGIYNGAVSSTDCFTSGVGATIVASNLSNISGASTSRSVIIGGTSQSIIGNIANAAIIAGNNNLISGTAGVIAGGNASSLGNTSSYASIISSQSSINLGSYSVVYGGDSHLITNVTNAAIIAGNASKVSGNYGVILGARNAHISSSQAGATILGDSNTTNAKYAKAANSLSLHYAGGVVVSGSSFEVERTGAFYGGVCMGTGRMVMTAISGSASISTLGISPGAYSGFAISAPGARTGDFVVISQTSYSGSTFGDAANTLLTFNPQAFQDQIRFYMFNPSGPSSVAPNPRLDWVIFKTSPLGAI